MPRPKHAPFEQTWSKWNKWPARFNRKRGLKYAFEKIPPSYRVLTQ
ncbi:hypothetical protein B4099_0819 [Heyndrickxia coagulans]|uniref:Uncharacterized protein n=1 Tax=Heyndrickxia coagulans TaxID=1398 RepID=A0A150KEK1_HEYCO|nr:hypothetical protein B4099_0819 [Heyndrickxia coagulans]